MIIFPLISILLIIYYYFRIIAEPLHPDSGEFIYPGIMQRLGFSKVLLQKFRNGKYIPASLSYDSFPPEPFNNFGDKKNYIGAFPHFRDKMFVWWFFEKIFKYAPLKAKQFRIINSLLILLISNLFFVTINEYLNVPFSIFWSIIFMLTIMLPHFDFYQIHTEEWGTFLLLFQLFLLELFPSNIYASILYGIILVLILFFIKITYAPTLLYFFWAPILIFNNMTFFKTSFTSAILFLIFLLLIFLITGKLKAVFWSINPLHLLKYKQGTSTSRSEEQRETSFSIKSFARSYLIEIIIGLLSFIVSILWILAGHFSPIEIFIFGWICVAALEIIIQGKYYPSHMLMLTVPGILFISKQNGIFSWVIAFCIILLWMKYFIISKELLIKNYGKQSQNPFLDSMLTYDVVSKIVKRESLPDESIIAIGYCSPIYSLARRKAALGIYEALTTIEPIDISKKLGKFWEWWILDALFNEKPSLLIDSKNFIDINNLQLSSGIKFVIIEQVQQYVIYKLDYTDVNQYPSDLGEHIFNY